MKRALILLAIALALQACTRSVPQSGNTAGRPSGDSDHTTAAPVPADSSSTKQCREDFGICVNVPSSWTITWNPLRDGTVGDIFLVGSWPFGHLPECKAIPTGQALIALSEVVPAADAGWDDPRPDRFEATRLSSGAVREGCEQPMAELFRFLDSGRALYAWMMFGPEFSKDVRTDAEAVLSSLHVDPSP
jgi:hypothetical protein